ncbi:YfhO family protein [Chitinophagaceae bacterium LB-8]|uniref:YfhO family protein n=1 Tax=Paraflavisolibacter caeni TaxID=2982496 RepID=A0A9X3B831_9BACT|nr:hypothetical protein [Paraflavisolibacter caeni]MCU7550025.1 YfhO family protein [Paraflavisolibacter caeni]
MRNAYFSLLGFISFLVFLINDRKNILQKIFCIAGLIMLILSFGGNVKESIYVHLPLLKSVRTNGEYRVFAIFSLILCGSFEINQIYSGNDAYKSKLKLLLKGFAIFLLLGAIIIAILLNPNLNLSISATSGIQLIKNVIDNITFKHTLLISLLVASFLSVVYLWSIYRNNWKDILLLVFLLDICLNSWLLLPITGVGRTSVFKMQQIISKSPNGFPSPTSINGKTSQDINEEEKALIGNWSWYDKQIVHPKIEYPSLLNGTERFYQSSDTALVKIKPFAFLLSNLNANIGIAHFTPNSFSLNLHVPRTDTLIILQNHFPGWKAYINDKRVPIFPYCETFMAIAVNENSQKVTLSFTPAH